MEQAWENYLNARFELIKAALKAGQDHDDIHDLLEINYLQTKLLCANAQRELDAE